MVNNLEILLQKYCPNGVERVELGKVCDINGRIGFRGYTRADQVGAGEGAISLSPANIINGRINYKDCTYISWKKYEESPEIMVKNGDIIFCKTASVGKVAFIENLQEKATINPQLVLLNNFKCNSKFLLYILSNNTFQNIVRSMQGIGSVPNIGQGKLSQISIPLPPLPVQEEIVRILDAMTDLQENLEKELEERRRQYAFYRDKLLSFNELITPPHWKIEWKQLGEIGKFYSGLSGKTKEDFTNGNAKFITYMNVFTHPILQIDVEDKVFIREGEKQHTIKYGDVLFTGSSETPDECGMTSVMTTKTEEDIYLNSFCFGYRFTSLDDICPSFMAHLFRSANIRKQIIKTANGVTRFNVSKILCEKISIPLPPLSIQQEIVEKLDTMEELVSNIENELTERKKQYEYYREKLFLFAK